MLEPEKELQGHAYSRTDLVLAALNRRDAYIALELEKIWHDHCLYPASQLPEHQARRILALHQYLTKPKEKVIDETETPTE